MRYIFCFFLYLLGAQLFAQEKCNIYSSYGDTYWKKSDIYWVSSSVQQSEDLLIDPSISYQSIDGWGGCFNEKSWQALSCLSESDRDSVIAALFGLDGCAFVNCRMPMGASDFALDYYSYNDNEGDFNMEKFSIERDRKYLIPYIKAALKYQPELKIWGSPWTPPAWMKTNKKYFQGELCQTPKILKAYALYFRKYIEAYRKEGINVYAVHIQNEPLHLPGFPSCGWNGQQMADFIGKYLGPELEKNNVETEIWLGTLNGTPENDEYKEFVLPALSDPEVAKYITGCGFQWYGDAAVESTIKNFPSKKIMQTETRCGNGDNSWNYAFETYDQMHWYLSRNAVLYTQWNMILDQSGNSTWGWKQSAMITVDSLKREVIFNPQYYVVKHFSHFVKPGAKRIYCSSNDYLKPIAFKNPDGTLVCVFINKENYVKDLRVLVDNKEYELHLEPGSINTMLLDGLK